MLVVFLLREKAKSLSYKKGVLQVMILLFFRKFEVENNLKNK